MKEAHDDAKTRGQAEMAESIAAEMEAAAAMENWLESFDVSFRSTSASGFSSGTSFVGEWTPTVNSATYTFLEDGTSTISSGARGRWTKKTINEDEVVYIVEWNSGFIDTLTLAEDGDTLTGTNNRNGTIKLVRKSD